VEEEEEEGEMEEEIALSTLLNESPRFQIFFFFFLVHC
jgi:hypothetical protein